ncbi:MAG: hypothetical protein ACE5GL_02530 [Calditrichia bacterium]
MKQLLAVSLLIVLINNGRAGQETLPYMDEFLVNRAKLALQVEKQLEEETKNIQESKIPQKSVALAVGMSAVVPGTGQFYAKSYIKAGLFMAVEIGAWAVNLSYNNKGDAKDAEFHTFADQHWSEYRYWSYINYINSQFGDPQNIGIYDFTPEPAPNGGTWYLINSDIYNKQVVDNLRTIEGIFPGHTHRLPDTKTQQYYEMIGKYPEQFGNAWEDAHFDKIYSGFEGDITPMNDAYSQMRAEANNLYNKAGYGAMVLIVNHLISAIDAGFTTRSYNRRQMSLSYQSRPMNGEFVNMWGVDFSW